MRKLKKNQMSGITLIALVVTIIVLLLLAGISIQMLSGDNGILNRTTEAREKTIHTNVFEQLQLEELAHLTDKSTSRDTSTLIEYLQSKSIIGDEIGENTGKYQVNVTALLGSKQLLGNGDATNVLKDVYMLEKQSTSTGSLVNTKVATTMPIRIAATTRSQVTYKVIYYGDNISNVANLGHLSDSIIVSNPSNPTDDNTDYSAMLYNYYKNMDPVGVEDSNTIEGTSATWLSYYYYLEDYLDYIEYKGGVYKVLYINDEPYNVSSVEKVSSNANFNKFGIYQIDGKNVLIDPNAEGRLVYFPVDLSVDSSGIVGNLYYLKENGIDIDLTRIVTGIVYEVDGKYYNESGEAINVICAEGPQTFHGFYYLTDNGAIDYGRPFTEGYQAPDNNMNYSYFDTSGMLVHVKWSPS